MKLSGQKSFKKLNVLCVGVLQCVCQRDRGTERNRTEESNCSGRNNAHLWPCVGKPLCVCACVCVSKYSRLVRLSSALTCITFLSIHCFPDYLPPEPLSPSLCPSISSPPHPPTRCTQHCKSTRQHSHTHTQPKGFTVRISRLCCYAYTHVVPVTLFTASFCSTCKFVFTVCSSHRRSRSAARRNSKQVFL